MIKCWVLWDVPCSYRLENYIYIAVYRSNFKVGKYGVIWRKFEKKYYGHLEIIQLSESWLFSYYLEVSKYSGYLEDIEVFEKDWSF